MSLNQLRHSVQRGGLQNIENSSRRFWFQSHIFLKMKIWILHLCIRHTGVFLHSLGVNLLLIKLDILPVWLVRNYHLQFWYLTLPRPVKHKLIPWLAVCLVCRL